MRSFLLFSTLLTWFMVIAPARAHFLFIRIVASKSKRVAEVYFSEGAEAGDPQFIDKIAGTQLWSQTVPGRFEPLKVKKGDDRLSALLPKKESVAVVGICRYGVLPRKTPFLLRHFPKSVMGSASQLNAMKPFDKVPLEILGRFQKDTVELKVLRGGKPWPNVKISTLDRKLRGGTLTCDAQGKVKWKPPRKGWFMVYVSDFQKKAGTYQGSKYQEIRDFATLSFQWKSSAPER